VLLTNSFYRGHDGQRVRKKMEVGGNSEPIDLEEKAGKIFVRASGKKGLESEKTAQRKRERRGRPQEKLSCREHRILSLTSYKVGEKPTRVQGIAGTPAKSET